MCKPLMMNFQNHSVGVTMDTSTPLPNQMDRKRLFNIYFPASSAFQNSSSQIIDLSLCLFWIFPTAFLSHTHFCFILLLQILSQFMLNFVKGLTVKTHDFPKC